MYCNHCLPCPARIDIARINQYLDLAEAEGGATSTLLAHYRSLSHPASACVWEGRCPFDVPVREQMKRSVREFES